LILRDTELFFRRKNFLNTYLSDEMFTAYIS